MSARYQILSSGGVWDFQTRAIVLPDRSSAAWQEYQSSLTAGETPLPPDVVGQLPLAEAQAARTEEINAYAAGLRNQAIRGRSAGEMASWSIKVAEARAFLASGLATSAPTLALTASVRGMPLADLVSRVVAQSAPFLQAEAYIDGIRGKHCDAVLAMTDVRDVVTYDWHAGWPAIPGGG